MKLWKCAALIATGGVVLQLGGCAAIVMQTLTNEVVTQAIVAVLSALVSGQTQTQ